MYMSIRRIVLHIMIWLIGCSMLAYSIYITKNADILWLTLVFGLITSIDMGFNLE